MVNIDDNKFNQPSSGLDYQEPNFPTTFAPKSNRNLKIIIAILVVLLITSFCFIGFHFNKNKEITPTVNPAIIPEPPKPSQDEQTPINYSVVVKENLSDKTKSDIFLRDPKTGQETFYITLPDVYRNHADNAEYHNGNLYMIHRTGGDEGYLTIPNWTDELWRYNKQKQGQKLYSVRGFGFQVSDDEKLIAIITNDEFVLLDNSGNKVKTFQSNDVVANIENSSSFGLLSWEKNVIWLVNTYHGSLTGLAKINMTNYEVTKYDLSGLSAGSEFTMNVSKEKIAFSTFPTMFTDGDLESLETMGTQIKLIIYDLSSKLQQTIATSIAKNFQPKWLDETTLEYNKPDGTGRMIKQIP